MPLSYRSGRGSACARALTLALTASVSAIGAYAQVVPARSAPTGGSVSGIVFDSLAGLPLGDALVQLVNADSLSLPTRTVTSDSSGRYRLMGVPRGRYLIGFMHPMLDSIGIEPRPREVFIDGAGAMRSDLSIPAPTTLRTVICGGDAVAAGDALLIGFVRSAADRSAVDSATVNAQWVEMTLQRGSLTREIAHRTVATQETGWYAICGAPSAGTVLLRASHAADSTEALELEVPANGFLRRDLYFGRARLAATDTVGAATDSLALSLGARRMGDGRLSGRVVGVRGGEPLAGARVGVVSGSQTRTDAAGRFTLTNLPTGTRTLEVRAVGRYPIMMPVDVVEGAAPLRIAMATLQSVMDTVRITATRGGSGPLLAFMQRKKSSGTGRFITSEDVQARRPIYTTDMLRTLPGVSFARDRNGEEFMAMRGTVSGQCRATVFLNGMSMRGLSVNDINGFVQPMNVIGIEVYSSAGAPQQFSEQNGCGSVVIWSR